jgi:hypothetical protein
MSRHAFIDVLLEVPVAELNRHPDPTRALWDMMRTKADQDCREAGATLRTDSTPEVIVRQAHTALIGDITLVASRWAVDVPDRVARAL